MAACSRQFTGIAGGVGSPWWMVATILYVGTTVGKLEHASKAEVSSIKVPLVAEKNDNNNTWRPEEGQFY